jgi:hypothetical protein
MSSTSTWTCDECQTEYDWYADGQPLERQGMDQLGMFCSMKCFDDFTVGLIAGGVRVGLRPGEEPDVLHGS